MANSNVVLCQQMFQTILEISKEIIPRSHKLTRDYVEMDLKLRELEKYLQENKDKLSEEEVAKIENEKN